ncbi:molybdenum cofactor guanylyltransferase MobA [Pseudomonas sp. HR96]|uniref:molybdenum cofactor guanylyltransferase MobA n=1 Tax=Pseudomonas sp. HR96 TaxID=1027966 RepID=UPI002A7606C1|nr:molybdenum cofactor guanylyltransferase MobA [Pseudomonas sp. HR96]WPO98504.1 molybdenum cofactor guanylyltransferase MobA [Pseudomonas sp. HR96]
MPNARALPACSILLLAGGRGQRMGGQDKGLLSWQGRPLIAHLHDKVRGLTDDLIISCNRNQDVYQNYADRLVTDDQTDFPGPMAGIRAGLDAARHACMLVLPCDVPNIDQALLQAMRECAAIAPERPLMLREGEHWQPLLCVIPTRHRSAFEQAWAAGERSPGRVMRSLQAQELACPLDDPRLANLNTPELLQAVQSIER